MSSFQQRLGKNVVTPVGPEGAHAAPAGPAHRGIREHTAARTLQGQLSRCPLSQLCVEKQRNAVLPSAKSTPQFGVLQNNVFPFLWVGKLPFAITWVYNGLELLLIFLCCAIWGVCRGQTGGIPGLTASLRQKVVILYRVFPDVLNLNIYGQSGEIAVKSISTLCFLDQSRETGGDGCQED